MIVCSPSFRVLYGPCRLSTFTSRRFATPAHVKYITLKRAGARKGRGRMSSADSFGSINCTPGNKPPPLIGSELARRPPALRGPIAPNYPTCISRSPLQATARTAGCATRKLKRPTASNFRLETGTGQGGGRRSGRIKLVCGTCGGGPANGYRIDIGVECIKPRREKKNKWKH